MKDLTDKKIIIAGVCRDTGISLPIIYENMNILTSSFKEVQFIFIENGSQDNTKFQLKKLEDSDGRVKVIYLEGLNDLNLRCHRLEYARNAYLAYIKNSYLLKDFDYLMILDLDEVNIGFSSNHTFKKSIDFLEKNNNCAGVFANQLPNYYDIWALRAPKIWNFDLYEEVFKEIVVNGLDFEALEKCEKFLNIRPLNISTKTDPILVESAFGGLGIYKLSYVLQNDVPYIGRSVNCFTDKNGNTTLFHAQICEHVSFNRGLRKMGYDLFILPYLTNNSENVSLWNFQSVFNLWHGFDEF